MIGWFGKEGWGSPACDAISHIETPVGAPCAWCAEPIGADDQGVIIASLDNAAVEVGEAPYHLDCLMRSIIGGLNHLKGSCSCYGGTDPADPPEMTRRQAALAASLYYSERRQS